ncbi:hypothetical protein DFP72DRAFT_852349 [Ephemerocybe angulata]|uniref:Uncharacterized protein n=1 Tax=Ephemerocybe angulata TaxID=980116 RepID=A0A8H6HNM3_9AGAR|nr:hypothetical protein DFP72DRAFT_852349 [Tulosesus angulatus]
MLAWAASVDWITSSGMWTQDGSTLEQDERWWMQESAFDSQDGRRPRLNENQVAGLLEGEFAFFSLVGFTDMGDGVGGERRLGWSLVRPFNVTWRFPPPSRFLPRGKIAISAPVTPIHVHADIYTGRVFDSLSRTTILPLDLHRQTQMHQNSQTQSPLAGRISTLSAVSLRNMGLSPARRLKLPPPPYHEESSVGGYATARPSTSASTLFSRHPTQHPDATRSLAGRSSSSLPTSSGDSGRSHRLSGSEDRPFATRATRADQGVSESPLGRTVVSSKDLGLGRSPSKLGYIVGASARGGATARNRDGKFLNAVVDGTVRGFHKVKTTASSLFGSTQAGKHVQVHLTEEGTPIPQVQNVSRTPRRSPIPSSFIDPTRLSPQLQRFSLAAGVLSSSTSLPVGLGSPSSMGSRSTSTLPSTTASTISSFSFPPRSNETSPSPNGLGQSREKSEIQRLRRTNMLLESRPPVTPVTSTRARRGSYSGHPHLTAGLEDTITPFPFSNSPGRRSLDPLSRPRILTGVDLQDSLAQGYAGLLGTTLSALNLETDTSQDDEVDRIFNAAMKWLRHEKMKLLFILRLNYVDPLREIGFKDGIEHDVKDDGRGRFRTELRIHIQEHLAARQAADVPGASPPDCPGMLHLPISLACEECSTFRRAFEIIF